jgi:hypothetical protein
MKDQFGTLEASDPFRGDYCFPVESLLRSHSKSNNLRKSARLRSRDSLQLWGGERFGATPGVVQTISAG